MSERIHFDADGVRSEKQAPLVMYTTWRTKGQTVKTKCGTRGRKLFLTCDPERVTCKRCL